MKLMLALCAALTGCATMAPAQPVRCFPEEQVIRSLTEPGLIRVEA